MHHTTSYLQRIQQDISAGIATEHTHRPALKALLEELGPGVTATNEPKHVACGAPDYVITRGIGGASLTLGYIEAKDIGKPLDQIERSDQMKRYLNSLDNLVLTDYLEFRWYVNGERRRVAQLATQQPDGKLKKIKSVDEAVTGLLTDFLAHQPETIQTPQVLAERLARLAHLIRDIIIEAFQQEQASSLLLGIRKAFADILIADLELPENTGQFADMFAQTLAYGLFSARIMDLTPGDFSRHEAQHLIPKTNPFLRDFFYQVSGPQLDDEPFAPFVDDLVAVLAHTDINRVLADFGKRTKQEDPIVHFYETFLAAYDPRLREARGVYYTPEPIVSYIVRSVDHLLKSRFNLPQGLSDKSKIKIKNTDPNVQIHVQ